MEEEIQEFSEYLRQERMRSPRTVARYKEVLRDFARFLAGLPDAQAASTDAVGKDTLSVFLRRTGDQQEPSRTSWNSRLAALRAFYGFRVKKGRLAMNPAMAIERLKVHSREPVPLSLDEMLRLVDAIEWNSADAYRARNLALVQVLYHCALRIAEVVSLNVDQVDLENRLFLDVRRKGDKHLAAAFNDVVAEALAKYLGERSKLLPPGQDETALFLSDRRRRLSIRTVQEMVGRYSELAEISRSVSPHLLRHSSATQLVDLGTPLRVVQEICGHASVTTTERYVHVNNGQRRLAVDKLGVEWRRRQQERRKARGGPDGAG